LAWSPLAQGRLAVSAGEAPVEPRVAEVIHALDAVAARSGTPRSAVAYAWVMAHPARPIPLIGSQNPARIREARSAYSVQLTREEWYRILVAARGARMPAPPPRVVHGRRGPRAGAGRGTPRSWRCAGGACDARAAAWAPGRAGAGAALGGQA